MTLQTIAARWFTSLVAVLLRSVRDPPLAYDLATETLATARLQLDAAPDHDETLAWLLGIAASVLDAAVGRGSVPSIERQRGGRPRVQRLTIEQQREITALAETHIELPENARATADALARNAPPWHVLRGLRPSGLVEADPLPDHERKSHGS
jgi:DNA-directed RNA polymerase specialized sigma24 family protein